jgi:hypothetical protein
MWVSPVNHPHIPETDNFADDGELYRMGPCWKTLEWSPPVWSSTSSIQYAELWLLLYTVKYVPDAPWWVYMLIDLGWKDYRTLFQLIQGPYQGSTWERNGLWSSWFWQSTRYSIPYLAFWSVCHGAYSRVLCLIVSDTVANLKWRNWDLGWMGKLGDSWCRYGWFKMQKISSHLYYPSVPLQSLVRISNINDSEIATAVNWKWGDKLRDAHSSLSATQESL